MKVDEYIVREWGLDAKTTFNVELRPDGDLTVRVRQHARWWLCGPGPDD